MATGPAPQPRIPGTRQAGVWLVGLVAAGVGLLDLVAEWDANLALVQFILLIFGPVVWMIRSDRLGPPFAWAPSPLRSWTLSLLCGAVSLGMHLYVGHRLGDLPPAYHDEYSYLFQAQTFLAGHWTFPSSPFHPELFDQMHVLNEGRMASRYLPGNALWLAPFVALGHPVWGLYVAGGIATIFVFWIGRELGDDRSGLLAGLLTGFSPGIAVFGNLLLAHQATLIGVTLFLWGMLRLQARRKPIDAFWAGLGLTWAMLCRPATAAGIGLPFGVWALLFLVRPQRIAEASTPLRQRLGVLCGLGLPLVIGFAITGYHNAAITGDWRTSTYQVYTDIYTPRHVYGFNNVVRGEQHLGPKVIDSYDRWAENLTPTLAAQNVLVRLLAGWQWMLDILPLSMTLAAALLFRPGRWAWLLASIASLHAIHIPYWYSGILGWHYVYESAPLWLLLLAGLSIRCADDWRRRGCPALPWWWGAIVLVSAWGTSFGLPGVCDSRLEKGLGSLIYPKQKHAEFRAMVESRATERPALVLVAPDPEDTHLDYVVNLPGLSADVLLGRYRPGQTDLDAVVRDFPDRTVYLCRPNGSQFIRLPRPTSGKPPSP